MLDQCRANEGDNLISYRAYSSLDVALEEIHERFYDVGTLENVQSSG